MNNTVVREIRGAKINPKSSFKNQGAQNTRGAEITRANTVYIRLHGVTFGNTIGHSHTVTTSFCRFLMEKCVVHKVYVMFYSASFFSKEFDDLSEPSD
jgi:hypothetical protein